MPNIDNKGRQYIFTIENHGLGPAIVKKIAIEVDGVPIEGLDHNKFIESGKVVAGKAEHYYYDTFSVDDYIPAGKAIEVYRFTGIRGPVNDVGQLWESRVRLIVEYQSILGDVFTLDTRNLNFKTPDYL